MKKRIIEWAIKQIVKDGDGTFAEMRYLEDVIENKFGEKQFIFAHRLVRPNPKTHNRPSNDTRLRGITEQSGLSSAASTDATPNQETLEHINLFETLIEFVADHGCAANDTTIDLASKLEKRLTTLVQSEVRKGKVEELEGLKGDDDCHSVATEDIDQRIQALQNYTNPAISIHETGKSIQKLREELRG